MRWRSLLAILTLLLFSASLAWAGTPAADDDRKAEIAAADKAKKDKKKKGEEESAAEAAEEEKKDEKKKDEEKAFDEVVKEMEKIEGLFTFYRDPKENKVLLEILPSQLDHDFIFSAKVDRATGERGLYGAMMAESFVFKWHKMGQRIQFVQCNTRFRADAGSPAARALEHSFSESIMASAKVESAPHPERESHLIDLSEIFLAGDQHGVGDFLKRVYKGGFSFDKENSGFLMVKSFPENSEIGTTARFKAGGEIEERSVTIPDVRSLSLTFRYSLVELPDNGYMPRLADDRVGYFMDQYLDFSSAESDRRPYVRYVNRWHLEKKDPDAALSEPVEPIVFWLENSIPEEYREFFREGVELWNPAFEKIGFKNAVAAKVQPDDAEWDPADIRYNTIRWFAAYDAGFAIGPSHSNPYTGQILDADIGFSDAIIRGSHWRYKNIVDPVAHLRGLVAEDGELFGPKDVPGKTLCTYGQRLSEMAAMARDVMSTRVDWSSEKEKEFVRQFIVEVTAHEVGHTLGLRHNFRASTIHGWDQLTDEELSRTVGLGASVMDYNPPIVALEGEEQGDYLPMVVGSYDRWAIEYGYKPIPGAATPDDELPELGKIARRSADPLLPYATDEDAGLGPRALDPRNSRFDFSEEPLDFYRHEFRLVDELWENMEAKLIEPGDSYEKLRRAFSYSWRPYFLGARVAAKHVGGIYHHRDHAGDPDGRLPYVPVPAQEQKAALRFLAEEIWQPGPFEVPSELLRKLQISRLRDFEFSIFTAERLDYPLHEVAAMAQGDVLGVLYDPIKLGRVQDLSFFYGEGEEVFGLTDLFGGVREAIWSELAAGGGIHSFRRNLQRAHLDHLTKLVLQPAPKTPRDAVALARADLVKLQGAIGKALKGRLDDVDQAHLAESQALIEETLKAPMIRGGAGGGAGGPGGSSSH